VSRERSVSFPFHVGIRRSPPPSAYPPMPPGCVTAALALICSFALLSAPGNFVLYCNFHSDPEGRANLKKRQYARQTRDRKRDRNQAADVADPHCLRHSAETRTYRKASIAVSSHIMVLSFRCRFRVRVIASHLLRQDRSSVFLGSAENG
jgi:hypothetical protein